MDEERSRRPSADLVIRLLSAVLDGADGTLKLYLTVSTGAVVLFTNLLANSRGPRPILAILVLSTFAFGGSALVCLRLLLGLVKLRTILAEAFLTGMTLEAAEGKIRQWKKQMQRPAKWTEGLFYAGVGLAAIFVAAIVAAR